MKKPVAIALSVLVSMLVISLHAQAAPMSCLEAFERQMVHQDLAKDDETEFRALLTKIDQLLNRPAGPGADNELRKILNDDVQATLVKITEVMNGEDRMIDDLLQGRRTFRNLQTVKTFGDALSEFQQLRSAEKSLSVRVKSLIPGLVAKKQTQLRSSIPLESIKLQAMKGEISRDVNLLHNLRDATSAHLREVESQTGLIDRLVTHLENQTAPADILQKGLITSVEFEAREQKRNLVDMARTARASIASIDLVLEDCGKLTKAIDQQLYVSLPRVAATTVTPGLQSGLNGVSPAQLTVDVAGQNQLAHASLSPAQTRAFDQQKNLLLSAKDPGIALATFEGILKLQTPELVSVVKKVLTRKDAVAFAERFLNTNEKTVWSVNMTEVHDSLIELVLAGRNATPAARESMVRYSYAHEFDARQKERILKVFLNDRLMGQDSRRTAVRILLAFPDVALIEQVSVALRKEPDSKFVEEIRMMIEARRHELELGGGDSKALADALARDVERAHTAKEAAALAENLVRLKDVAAKIKREFGRNFRADNEWLKTLAENPHPERSEVIIGILEEAMLGKRSIFYSKEYEVPAIERFVVELKNFIEKNEVRAPRLALGRIKKWIRPYKDESRGTSLEVLLQMISRQHVDGLRELLDSEIAKSTDTRFQTSLMSARLRQDRILGSDALTEVYRGRIGDLIESGWPASKFDYDLEASEMNESDILVAREILRDRLLEDPRANALLVLKFLPIAKGREEASLILEVASKIDFETHFKERWDREAAHSVKSYGDEYGFGNKMNLNLIELGVRHGYMPAMKAFGYAHRRKNGYSSEVADELYAIYAAATKQ